MASCIAVDTDEPVVSFTFDDGPDPAYTPLVLDALRERRARATFFLVGEAALAHPDLVRDIVDRGHELALHGHTHDAMPSLPVRRRAASLASGRRAVATAGGRPPRWFRAPYGEQTPGTVVAARLLGMRPVMWSAYAAEWEDRPLSSCVEHAAAALTPGAILLLHDGTGAPDEEPARRPDEVVALLEALLDVAADRGFEVVPVGELVRRGRPRRRFWFRKWRVA